METFCPHCWARPLFTGVRQRLIRSCSDPVTSGYQLRGSGGPLARAPLTERAVGHAHRQGGSAEAKGLHSRVEAGGASADGMPARSGLKEQHRERATGRGAHCAPRGQQLSRCYSQTEAHLTLLLNVTTGLCFHASP